MATRNVVPRGDLEGNLGTGEKRWSAVYAGNVNSTYENVAAMVADTNLAIGTTASTKYYESVNDGGCRLYNIREKVVSDVEDGDSIIFLDNGNVAERVKASSVKFLFPKNINPDQVGECQIIVTGNKTIMIDSHYDVNGQFDYLVNYLKSNGIKKIDYFVLTHYHGDHYLNINKFLNNQSDVSFANTKWYLPYFTIDTSVKDTVIGWLQDVDADYEILTNDITVDVDFNVSMDILCCSKAFNDYVDDNGGSTDLNPHSLYTLIKHENVKVLYTGDGTYPATKWVYENYDFGGKIDILKVPHHGVSSILDSEWDAAFYRKTSPLFAIYNHGGDHYRADVSVYNPFGENSRGHTQYPVAFGARTYWAALNDVEFESDGKNVAQITHNAPLKNQYNSQKITFFVDADADTTITPDGTSDKPFASINEAIAALPENAESMVVEFVIAQGSYPSLFLTNYTGEIQFSPADVSETINVGRILIANCSDVIVNNNLTTKQLWIEKSNVRFLRQVDLVPDSTSFNSAGIGVEFDGTAPGCIFQSRVRFFGLTIDSDSITENACCLKVSNSEVECRHLTVKNDANITGTTIASERASFVNVDEVDDVVNCSSPIIGLGWGSLVILLDVDTLTSFTGSRLVADGTGLFFKYANKIGTSAQRPTPKYSPVGAFYYDTTLNHLLINNGTNWVDTTNGNAL